MMQSELRELQSEDVEKDDCEIYRLVLGLNNLSRGLQGITFFKGLLFLPSGKTKGEEQGNQLSEMNPSKHSTQQQWVGPSEEDL